MSNPVTTAAIIVGAILIVYIFAAVIRDHRIYGQHKEIASHARLIAREIKGQVFRDHEDLVISGSADGLRLMVRFGYGENTPGVYIRMDVPANFQMSLAMKGKEQLAGRSRVVTNDPGFDTRFALRSDDPRQAELFIGSPVVRSELSSLCCSSIAYVIVGRGVLEQSELAIPDNPGRHVVNHIRSMQKLAEKFRQMPLAEQVVLTPVVRERRYVLWASILLGLIVAGVGLYTASHQPSQAKASETWTEPAPPGGMSSTDASLLPGIHDWQSVSSADFDPDGVAWLKVKGFKAGSRIEADFAGEENALDVAYVLKNGEGRRRLVIIAKKKVVYDTQYPFIGICARIPKKNLERIEWASRKPEPPDGDALIFTLKAHDLGAGLIMYLSQGKLVSGVPKNYQVLDITE